MFAFPVIFVAAVDGDCDGLKQGTASSQVVFFSTIASSTIEPLAAPSKEAVLLVVATVTTRQKRHFRPDSNILAVDGHIKRLEQRMVSYNGPSSLSSPKVQSIHWWVRHPVYSATSFRPRDVAKVVKRRRFRCSGRRRLRLIE